MAETLYATFPDASLAEKATGALLDYGVRAEDVSLVTKETDTTRRDYAAHSATLEERRPWTDAPADRAASAEDRTAAAGDRAAADVSGAVGASNTAANYETSARNREVRADEESDYRTTDEAARSKDYRDWRTDEDPDRRTELASKQGLSTTTPSDAGVGAAKGAGIGLGLGILGALASLAIPGVGLVVGGGALATAIAGAVGTTAAGAVAGGVYGYLKDQGMPESAAARYNEVYEQGGAILAIQTPSGDIDRATIEGVLSKYGATNVSTFAGAA